MKKRSLLWLITVVAMVFGLTACFGNDPVVSATPVTGATTAFTVDVAGSLEIDLGDYFTVQGDVTYSVTSSSANATVSAVSGGSFSVTGVSVGSAEITIKVLNGSTELARAKLQITVQSQDLPSVIKASDDLELTFIGSNVSKPISDYIFANGRDLIYTITAADFKTVAGAVSADPTVTAVKEGDNVKITASRAGSAVVTVKGTFAGQTYQSVLNVTVLGDAVPIEGVVRETLDLTRTNSLTLNFADYFTIHASNVTFAITGQSSTDMIKQINYLSGDTFTVEGNGTYTIGSTDVTIAVRRGTVIVAQKVITIVTEMSADLEAIPTANRYLTIMFTESNPTPTLSLKVADYIKVNNPNKTFNFFTMLSTETTTVGSTEIVWGNSGVSITQPTGSGNFQINNVQRPDEANGQYHYYVKALLIAAHEGDEVEKVHLYITVRSGNPIVDASGSDAYKNVELDLLNAGSTTKKILNDYIFTSYAMETDDLEVSVSSNNIGLVGLDTSKLTDPDDASFVLIGRGITTGPVTVTVTVKLNGEVSYTFVIQVTVVKSEAYEQKNSEINLDVMYFLKETDLMLASLVEKNIIDSPEYNAQILNKEELSTLLFINDAKLTAEYGRGFSITPIMGTGSAKLLLKITNVANPSITYTFEYDIVVSRGIVEAPTEDEDISFGFTTGGSAVNMSDFVEFESTDYDLSYLMNSMGVYFDVDVVEGADIVAVNTDDLDDKDAPIFVINAVKSGTAKIIVTMMRANDPVINTGLVYTFNVEVVEDRAIAAVLDMPFEFDLVIDNDGTKNAQVIDIDEYYELLNGEAPVVSMSNPLGALYFNAVLDTSEGNVLTLTPIRNTPAPITVFVELRQEGEVVLTFEFEIGVVDNRDVAILNPTINIIVKEGQILSTDIAPYVYINPNLASGKEIVFTPSIGQDDKHEFATLVVTNGMLIVTGVKQGSIKYYMQITIRQGSINNTLSEYLTINVTIAEPDYAIIDGALDNKAVDLYGTYSFTIEDLFVLKSVDVVASVAVISGAEGRMSLEYDADTQVYTVYFNDYSSTDVYAVTITLRYDDGNVIVAKDLEFDVAFVAYKLLHGAIPTVEVELNKPVSVTLADFVMLTNGVIHVVTAVTPTNVELTSNATVFSMTAPITFKYDGVAPATIILNLTCSINETPEYVSIILDIVEKPAPFEIINPTPEEVIPVTLQIDEVYNIESAIFATIIDTDNFGFEFVEGANYTGKVTLTPVWFGYEISFNTAGTYSYTLSVYEGFNLIAVVATFEFTVEAEDAPYEILYDGESMAEVSLDVSSYEIILSDYATIIDTDNYSLVVVPFGDYSGKVEVADDEGVVMLTFLVANVGTEPYVYRVRIINNTTQEVIETIVTLQIFTSAVASV